jgi:hypothetical protein
MSDQQNSKEWIDSGEKYVSPLGITATPLTAASKRTGASTPAPKKDQIKGSKKNPKGSASSAKKSKKITFSKQVEESLRNKVTEHNEKASKGRKTTIATLKAVYRRGAGAYSTSHRPGKTRNQWALARVNAFLRLLKSGKPTNSAYTQDNDLLPASHPKSTKKSNSVITASALVPEEQDFANALLEVVAKHGKFNEDGVGVWAGYTPAAENEDIKIGVTCKNCVFYSEDSEGSDVCQIISLPIEDLGKCRLAVIPDFRIDREAIREYKKTRGESETLVSSIAAEMELSIEILDHNSFEHPEDAILALTEFSGLGYEAEPAIRASWLRAVDRGDNPYIRARHLAEFTYNSLDADLLPIQEEGE